MSVEVALPDVYYELPAANRAHHPRGKAVSNLYLQCGKWDRPGCQSMKETEVF